MKKPMANECLDCARRKANCHAYCESYQKYLDELKAYNEHIIESKKKEQQSYIKHDDKTYEKMKRNRYRKVIK